MTEIPPIVLALTAGLSNAFGGLAITSRRSWNRAVLSACLAASAGYMLALSLLKLIPLSFEYAANAAVSMLAGYLIVHVAEHVFAPHFHFGEETHHDEVVGAGVGWAAFAGLSVHSLMDGVAMASGFSINYSLGIVIFVALLLHKIPEGFTMATVLVSAGRSRRTALMAASFLGVFTVVGFVLTSVLRSHLAIFLPLSAGATLYVAASDLIPAVNEEKGLRMSLFVFMGVAAYYVASSLVAGH